MTGWRHLSTIDTKATVVSSTNLSSYSYLNISSTNNNLNNLSSQSYFLTNYTNLNSLNVSGISKLNGATTINSTLYISGNTILNNFTTINSPLYINTYQSTSTSALNINSTEIFSRWEHTSRNICYIIGVDGVERLLFHFFLEGAYRKLLARIWII